MSFKKDAQIDVGQLIVANLQREIAVGKVRVEGIAHTNFEFLDLVTRDLLDAKNVGDVIIGSRNIGAKLLKFGVFKNVEIELKADPEVPGVVDIIYHVEESPRIYASTGADFGATDASMVFEN